MSIERLKPGEIVFAVAALTLLGLMSATWFEHPTAADIPADAVGFQTAPDAWHAFRLIDWALLACIAGALSAAAVVAGGSKANLPLDAAAVVVVLGLVALGLIGYRIIEPITIQGVGYRRDLPLFLAFAMAALMVLGALWALRARDTSLARELARASRRG
ncbi:MAG: hypothetical protein ABR536_03175 [Solirubrobacterales bacterium]